MKDNIEVGRWLWIVLVGIIIALLGISPRPNSIITSLDTVSSAQKTSNFDIVAENLAVVAREQPQRSGFWEAAGEAALSAGDAKNASIYFSRAAAKGELSLEGYLAWGDVEWHVENPHTALQIWEISSHLGGLKNEILTRQVEVYRTLGDDLALIETIKILLDQPPTVIHQPAMTNTLSLDLGLLLAAYDPASALVYLSQSLDNGLDLDAQISILYADIQQALSHDDPAYALLISGRSLANLGYWDLAEKSFKNAVELQPEYAEAWAYLGEARQHTENSVEPLLALEKAIELGPNSIAANTFSALYWQRQGEYKLALEYLQAAAELDPENPVYLVEIGNLLALLGDLESGADYYWQAIALSPNDPKYVREFLNFSIRYNLNLRLVALPVARQLVMLDPKNPASLDIMGELLLRLDDTLNAERFFLRALAQEPEYDRAHLHLGDLYRSQLKNDLAYDHYSRVLETSTSTMMVARAQEALDTFVSP